jgi:subtilase family serine protease
MNREEKAESVCASSREVRMIWLCIIALVFTACVTLPASAAAAGQVIAHNTPRYVSTAKKIRATDASKTIDVDIWLNPHNRAQLDALAGQLYDRNSPNYRHWLTRKDLAARFMPTAEEAKTVQKFFTAHNLKVMRVGNNNFFVRARGTVADMEKAFHVQLNDYQERGKIMRANDRDPFVEGAAGALVMAVSGLDSGKYEHPMMAKTGPDGKVVSAAASERTASAADIYSNNCFNGTETESFSTNNNGTLPIGTYSGNHLNEQSATSNGCGYTPPMIHAAYNLSGLYKEGYNGSGQTIGIIDWCGEFTIQSDANAFSAQYGLPQLTAPNFAITNIPTPTFCEGYDDVEINIDVEWSHTVAPGASINLIVPPSPDFSDINEAEYIAITSGFGIGTDTGSVISGSYGAPENEVPETILLNENLINEIASILGVSADFSSGDTGDFTADGIPATVSTPADTPWATAVGGITLALNADNSINWQAGWGNNQTLLAETGIVFDPPLAFSFIGGSGGGRSNCATQTTDSFGNIVCIAGFPKPSYQKALPGHERLVPDISWLADPYTGVAILVSIPGQVPEQVWQIWGGTSVACPMFSGLWAIANQEAMAGGSGPLGLAAAYIYSLPSDAVFDVVPVTSKTNVKGVIQDTTGTTKYTPAEVVGDPGDVLAPENFVSAIWDYPYLQYTSLVLSFGTDCASVPGFGTPCNSSSALHTKPGWDNVTGVGTPNAKVFADSFF